MREWEKGTFLGASDEIVLQQAFEENLTLVTYDQRTITPLLKSWSESRHSHGGVIFVDWRTIAPNSLGGLIKALCSLWDAWAEASWIDRVIYLRGS
ncbi:MAG: hypothetical protein NVS2B14_14080 [Chamaesiphon sp.]